MAIDGDAFYANEDRRHIPLPTYPFERQRFWVDPAAAAFAAQSPQAQVSSSATHLPFESVASPMPVENIASGSLPVSRKDRIASRLIELLLPVSGRERSQISSSA